MTKFISGIAGIALLGAVAVFFVGYATGQANGSAPESCEQAFETMQDMLDGPVTDLVEVGMTSTDLIPQAFDAGLYGDVAGAERVLSTMDASISKLDNAAVDAKELRTKYDDLVEECTG